MSAIGALRRIGRRVPEDIAVVGYDDISLAAHFHPALTTIRQPIEAAGKALVEVLLAQLAGERPASVLLPTGLMRRDSSGPPATVAAHMPMTRSLERKSS